MANQFDKLIKSITREITDQKALRRRSSLTLETQSKSINVTCTIARNGNGVLYCQKSGLVVITPNDSLPQIYQTSFATKSGRDNRGVTAYAQQRSTGTAFAIVPSYGDTWDSGLGNNQSKTVTVPVTITSTGDFTLTASTMNYERA